MLAAPKYIPYYLLRPVRLFREYDRSHLRPDLIAAITVTVILLPQALAYALIVELPPEMGIYAAVAAGIVGALWGSSFQAHTGPTNALSLLVLSSLLITNEPGTPQFLVAAGMMAVMVGLFQLVMGLLRLGVLVNFVSHSVIVGFASGAGVLIAAKQLRHLLGLEFESHTLVETIQGVAANLLEAHQFTAALGIASIVIILWVRRINSKLPTALISMAFATIVVFILGLDDRGVAVIGLLPRGFPPLADIPIFDLDLIAQLSSGALAVGAIEGVIATCAVKALGGAMLGRLAPQSEQEQEAVKKADLDTSRILDCDELVNADQIFFAATGITDGVFLSGVRYHGNIADTESLILNTDTDTSRRIQAEHIIGEV